MPDDAKIDTLAGSTSWDEADNTTLEWEKLFIETTLRMTSNTSLILPNAKRSFGDISTAAIQSDSFLLMGGYALMFLYTIFTLSTFNRVEFRLYLSVSGIVAILLGMSIGVSLSSAVGYPWTPLHPMIPLICLGVGIDDMFVIVQSISMIKKKTDLCNWKTKYLSL